MIHNNILTYLTDPFDHKKVLAMIRTPKGEIKKININEISDLSGNLITHDAWRVVDLCIENECDPHKSIFEINHFQHYITGRPASDFDNTKPWDTLSILSDSIIEEDVVDEYRKIIWGGGIHNDEENLLKLLTQVLNGLYKYVENIDKNNKDFISSFLKVELPVSNIMLNCQYKGIKYNRSKVDDYLNEIELEYFTGLATLADEYNYDGGLFESEYLVDYIFKNNIEPLSYFKEYGLNKYLDYSAEFDVRIKLIKHLRNLSNTKSTLIKMTATSSDYIHPIYDCMGTVTGRIIAIEPIIQHLKKEYRSVLIADDDYTLAYLDYSQFEPRILANLSKDKKLCDLIGSEDFYVSFSDEFFEGKISRDVAKTTFLHYCYGGTPETISSFLEKKCNIHKELLLKYVSNIFEGFPDVNKWKSNVIEENEKSHYVTAGHGIRRVFKESEINTYRAHRQSVNHIIQAGGAAVLKSVILEISNNMSNVNILLPMHDALLIEVPTSKLDDTVNDVKNIFIQVFGYYYPDIPAEVTNTVF